MVTTVFFIILYYIAAKYECVLVCMYVCIYMYVCMYVHVSNYKHLLEFAPLMSALTEDWEKCCCPLLLEWG